MKIKSIKDVKIRTKLILIGAVSVLGLFVLGSESVYTAWQISQVNAKADTVWLNAVIIAEGLNTETSDYRIQESHHAITTDSEGMAVIEEDLKKREARIDGQFQNYQALSTSEEDQAMIRDARALWKDYLRESKEVIAASQDNETPRVLELLTGRSEELFNDTSNLLLEAVDTTKQKSQQAREHADEMYRHLSHMKFVVIAADALVVFWLIAFLIESIEKPAEALADAARRATNGNLDIYLDYKSEDEIGILTESMNQLIKRLKAIIGDEKKMFQEIGNDNLDISSECEQSYRGDFAPILYSFTSLQSRLKESRQQQEEEVEALKEKITELERQIADLEAGKETAEKETAHHA